jgi:hypothetical protein
LRPVHAARSNYGTSDFSILEEQAGSLAGRQLDPRSVRQEDRNPTQTRSPAAAAVARAPHLGGWRLSAEPPSRPAGLDGAESCLLALAEETGNRDPDEEQSVGNRRDQDDEDNRADDASRFQARHLPSPSSTSNCPSRTRSF